MTPDRDVLSDFIRTRPSTISSYIVQIATQKHAVIVQRIAITAAKKLRRPQSDSISDVRMTSLTCRA